MNRNQQDGVSYMLLIIIAFTTAGPCCLHNWTVASGTERIPSVVSQKFACYGRPWLVDTNHPGAKLVVYDLTGGAEVVMWYAMLIRPGERFGSPKFACCCSFSW